MTIFEKFEETISNYDLLKTNDALLLALSGGADSTALVLLCSKIKEKYNLQLSAVYINHQIRKSGSKKEEKFCQSLCDKFDIELHIIKEDIPTLSKKLKKGIEETARDFRYGVFESLSKEFGYTKVALGHHINDRVETVLFRIFRGTGRLGVLGIPPKREKYIRPLFDISKDEILEFLDNNSQEFCEDVSNRDNKYSRNYLRNKIIPLLKENVNNSIETALINLSETAYEEEKYLAQQAQKKLKKIISFSQGGKIQVLIPDLIKLDKWLRRRIFRDCLAELTNKKFHFDKETIDRCDFFIFSGQSAVSLPQKIQLRKINDELLFYKQKRIKFKKNLTSEKQLLLEKLNYQVKMTAKSRVKTKIVRKKNSFLGQFDVSKLTPPFSIRTIEQSDRFSPLGLNGTKKIGDYLTDRKINPVLRDEIPVVTDKKGIFWLVGFEIDNRVKIDTNTKEVLEIEFKSKK